MRIEEGSYVWVHVSIEETLRKLHELEKFSSITPQKEHSVDQDPFPSLAKSRTDVFSTRQDEFTRPRDTVIQSPQTFMSRLLECKGNVNSYLRG